MSSCCICEGMAGEALNIVILDVKGQVAGHGWGCVVCDLPLDGACAVLCEPCVLAWQQGQPLRFACRGYPATDGRAPIEELVFRHAHDLSKHVRNDDSGNLAEFYAASEEDDV